MSRGHIRATKAFTETRQRKALEASNVKAIYLDDIPGAVASMRKGGGLHVAGLRGLAGNRDAILAVLKALHAKGAWAVDTHTGRRSDGPDGVELLAEAIAELANERRGDWLAGKRNGRKGGLAYGANAARGRMPWGDLEKLWRNSRLTNAQVEQASEGDGKFKRVSWATIHRKLGARGNGALSRIANQT